MHLPRMKWFHCESCGREFEDLVEKDDTQTICECGKEASLLKNLQKQIHNKGWKYDQVAWSLWRAGD